MTILQTNKTNDGVEECNVANITELALHALPDDDYYLEFKVDQAAVLWPGKTHMLHIAPGVIGEQQGRLYQAVRDDITVGYRKEDG
jgi:hypothetical protein